MAWGQQTIKEPVDAAPPQPIAYYFPNWHRHAGQNGELFGEWMNVRRALPRFEGHQQPKRPVWGIEDEADPKVMAKKIGTAADYGLGAFVFCWYYHEEGPYLDSALNNGYLQADNRSRLPFALMWANHDVGGRAGAVSRLVFDRIADLLVERYFKEPTYWRIKGRCYFSIYEPMTFIRGMGGVLPAREALDSLRDKARRAGCGEIHINLIDWQLAQQPDAGQPVRDLGADSVTSYVWLHTVPLAHFPASDYAAMRTDYFAFWDRHWAAASTPHFPNVIMGWDPTPRLRPDQPHTGKSYPDTAVLTGNTPQEFRQALLAARERAMKLPAGQRYVTIYAWNEWTEGGYLEPEESTGLQYLEAIRDVFAR